ncbi:WGR domain-containing protein (plasmid) [Peteryoungia desertarenae]|uniref:WGR domain-containing protein n=1 Tax=Peteryoungia desertarenae TaxID=1813451 RepID=A0ABX6QSH8_9HYPH|nr:WGR domain-containing protein [Peteryoungia desertarenae]QLF71554.1 WGR domain-containing protein [Peteryoungia desertarenae]
MNRLRRFDSKVSLDAFPSLGKTCPMLIENLQIYIERVDSHRNMARFYALELDRDLFGNTLLRRKWGRIGTRGREKLAAFDEEQAAIALFLKLLRQKRRRGYRARKRAA